MCMHTRCGSRNEHNRTENLEEAQRRRCEKFVGVRRLNFQILLSESYILLCKIAIIILF